MGGVARPPVGSQQNEVTPSGAQMTSPLDIHNKGSLPKRACGFMVGLKSAFGPTASKRRNPPSQGLLRWNVLIVRIRSLGSNETLPQLRTSSSPPSGSPRDLRGQGPLKVPGECLHSPRLGTGKWRPDRLRTFSQSPSGGHRGFVTDPRIQRGTLSIKKEALPNN